MRQCCLLASSSGRVTAALTPRAMAMELSVQCFALLGGQRGARRVAKPPCDLRRLGPLPHEYTSLLHLYLTVPRAARPPPRHTIQ